MRFAATARAAIRRLNLGDSFAYALSIHLDEPLLFKGNDFTQTDVKKALQP